MAYTISSGRLRSNGSNAEYIKSPYTGGAFGSGHPKILVMHFTYGGTARSSAEWFRDRNNPGSSAHVVLDRDGSVIQCVTFDTIAWHAGRSSWRGLEGLNQFSIGIELSNWGYLKKSASGWSSYTGVKIADPVMAKHKNGNPDGTTTEIGWEPYPQSQFETAVGVAKALKQHFGLTEIVGHDDISPTRKWDPGPAFDMARFRSLVFEERGSNESNEYAVAVAEGLNLRRGPGTHFDTIKLLPNGTKVLGLDQSGRWLMVSVLKANGVPTDTGWVHSAYLT